MEGKENVNYTNNKKGSKKVNISSTTTSGKHVSTSCTKRMLLWLLALALCLASSADYMDRT